MATEEGIAISTSAMTDDERVELCRKLDKQLDDFINGLERKRYEDGWPEDRWEEEMSKHPFFIKTVPTKNEEMSPLTEGLALLKYDPDENTTEELANNYKGEGNFNFEHKNYKLAIMAYTEGIRVKCGNPATEASLYNNRAAAHWHISNFRSSFLDSEKALTFNPTHKMARIRAIKAAIKIRYYEQCIKHCDIYLKQYLNNEEVMKLKVEARKLLAIQERDQRKTSKVDGRNKKSKALALKSILEQGINIGLRPGETPSISNIEPTSAGTWDCSVYYEDNQLWWPIVFLYPEACISDLIKSCSEDYVLRNVMGDMFPPPWDSKNKYSLETINVYYEGVDKNLHKVDISKVIKDILQEKQFVVNEGTLAFFIVVRDTDVEKRLLEVAKQ